MSTFAHPSTINLPEGADDTVRTSARFSILASEWPEVKARLVERMAQD